MKKIYTMLGLAMLASTATHVAHSPLMEDVRPVRDEKRPFNVFVDEPFTGDPIYKNRKQRRKEAKLNRKKS